jgi:hypothetical protein
MSHVNYTCDFKPPFKTREQIQVSVFISISAKGGFFKEPSFASIRHEPVGVPIPLGGRRGR